MYWYLCLGVWKTLESECLHQVDTIVVQLLIIINVQVSLNSIQKLISTHWLFFDRKKNMTDTYRLTNEAYFFFRLSLTFYMRHIGCGMTDVPVRQPNMFDLRKKPDRHFILNWIKTIECFPCKLISKYWSTGVDFIGGFLMLKLMICYFAWQVGPLLHMNNIGHN